MPKITLRSKQAPLLALVACLTLQICTSQSAVAQLSNGAQTSKAENRIRIERKVRGITAELVDAGDYYFRPDGSKVTMLRKKDVFVVKVDPSKRQRAMQRFKSRYGDRVKEIKQHRLGGVDVVRLDNRTAVKEAKKQSFNIQPQMLAALDSSVTDMVPVFTTKKGQGDLLLLPKITLQLNDAVTVAQALPILKRKYGVEVNRKLRLAGNIYSLNFTNRSLVPNSQFSVVRQIMNESFVDWAEPQFFVKPERTALPNDALVSDQWHLANDGFRGSRCDVDCDADDAWVLANADDDNGVDSVFGADTVIAIIDDGVQLDHPDLSANIWVNSGEIAGNDIDDDSNGYADDINGYDFVDDSGASTCENLATTDDGDVGQDADPSPRDTVDCVINGQAQALENDNHGTAVAGLAAAVGNNSIGVAGVAYKAKILVIRAISDFDEVPLVADDEPFCDTIAEAMEYAAQHADVINNSWSIPITCTALETALTRVTAGTVPVDTDSNDGDGLSLGSKRDGLGSPVIFASGNSASGWVKVTVPVSAGEHAYEWRFLRTDEPDPFDEFNIDEAAWLDDITWPDDGEEGEDFEDFAAAQADFTFNSVLNQCNDFCDGEDPDPGAFEEETNLDHVRSGSSSAKFNMLPSGENAAYCSNNYLHIIKDGPSGEISFWVWVSSYTGIDDFTDKFEFLVDGKEKLSYGDLPSFGFVDNAVAYPARLSATIPGVIAVGASTSGDLSGDDAISLLDQQRASYSQYGPTLDVVAPGNDQHLGISTTDRITISGTDTDGYNLPGNTNDYSDRGYTNSFGGTSASAAMVSGVAAAIIAVDNMQSAADVRDTIRATADEIGSLIYSSGRNDFFGHGRVNMYRAVDLAQGGTGDAIPASCDADAFDYSVTNDLLLPNYTPQPTQLCAAEGPIPESDDVCVPIKAVNGNIALICL